MARIVHVASFGRKPKGAFEHSVEYKISNGLTRNGHYVTNFSDREVAKRGLWLGRRGSNSASGKALRDYCYHVQPDILLLGHADTIHSDALRAIRQDVPHVKIVQWNVDPLFDNDNVSRLRSKLEVVDATLVSTAGNALNVLTTQGSGAVGFLPNPVDFSIETGRNHENIDLPQDVFYACGNPGTPRYVCGKEWLPDDFVKAIIAGAQSTRFVLSGGPNRPYLVGHAYQKALQSAALGLNVSRRNDVFLYSSDRLAHMCGNGMGILIDRATGYDLLFGEDEFAFFSTLEEAQQRIRHLLCEPILRQNLAEKGRARYHSLFNEQNLARYIVEVAFDQVKTSDYVWPTIHTPRRL